ncbi:hypothetical protein RsTz2092_06930 [Deferribacterales bacterium RsTz2092]|nr:hypothetical protein AGMMS49941_05080 [Deferribacterales bacterium]
MAKKPSISVIVPIHNAAGYLHKSLDSLVAQTFTDIEVLCIDDGSTDNSLAILQEYAGRDANFKLFTQAERNIGYTRNVGLRNARGKYVMWCDPDDWYEPTMCEEMFSAIEREGVDLVECGTNVINEANDSARYEKMSKYVSTKQLGRCILTNDIKKNISGVLWNKIFKRELLEEYSILAPDDSIGAEDTAMVMQYLLVAGSYYGLDRVLYNYLLRGVSATGLAQSDYLALYFRKTVSAYRCAVEFAIKHNLLGRDNFILGGLSYYASELAVHDKYSEYFETYRAEVLCQLADDLLDDREILLSIKQLKFKRAHQLGLQWVQFRENKGRLQRHMLGKVKATHGK